MGDESQSEQQTNQKARKERLQNEMSERALNSSHSPGALEATCSLEPCRCPGESWEGPEPSPRVDLETGSPGRYRRRKSQLSG